MSLGGTMKNAAMTVLGQGSRAVLGRAPDLRSIRSFLVLEYTSALGTVIHATPMLRALREAVPEAEVVVCASGFALEVFAGNPSIDRLVATPDPTRDWSAAVRALRQARPAGRFATLLPISGERTTIGTAAVCAGATDLIGFTLVPQLFRVPLTFDYGLSQINNNLRIIEALGYPVRALEPEVFFSADDLAHAHGLLARFADPARPVAVFVTQTSVTQRKSWRPERFVAIARMLLEQRGMNVLLVGSGSEREATGRIAEAIGSAAQPAVQNVAGETNLSQLAALLSLCRVGVTLDTGTMHVGRAVGLPMVIIAPAWSPPVEWLPVGDSRFIILKNLDLPSGQFSTDYVIDEVSVSEVAAALGRLLNPAQEDTR